MENAVSVLVIGWERKNGVKIMPALFESTPYTMTAFLDIMESRQPHRYSSHNLGAVLDSLHPRPRALVVGPAVVPALNTDLEIVWSNYVREVLEKEGAQEGEVNTLKSALVLLNEFVYIDPSSVTGPPRDVGWEQEMFSQLDSAFKVS